MIGERELDRKAKSLVEQLKREGFDSLDSLTIVGRAVHILAPVETVDEYLAEPDDDVGDDWDGAANPYIYPDWQD